MIAALRHRYESLVAMQFELPTTVVFPRSVDVAQIVQLLPVEFLQSPAPEGENTDAASETQAVNTDALVLAVFGWEAESGHIKGLVTCNACFRRLGLWLFLGQPRLSSPPVNPVSEEETASVMSLNVVNEHREYCPWVNAESQNGNAVARKPVSGSQGKPGWQLLLKVLNTAYHFRSQLSTTLATTKSDAHSILDEQSRDFSNTNTPSLDSRLTQEERDRERWAKLKNLKKIFDVKGNKKRSR